MELQTSLAGKTIVLTTFTENDINERYISWLNDPEVVEYLEVRFSNRTLEGLRKSFRGRQLKRSSPLYNITVKKTNCSIGTCSLDIDQNHLTAKYGYIVGDKNYWGTDAALEAQVILIDYVFDVLKLRKITGGTYNCHVPSRFNFARLGFVCEGILKEQYKGQNGEFHDHMRYGLLKSEWALNRTKFNRLRTKKIVDKFNG